MAWPGAYPVAIRRLEHLSLQCALPTPAALPITTAVRLILFSLLAVSLGFGASAADLGARRSDGASVAAIVKRLGGPSMADRDLEALDTDRCAALPLLVSALEALPPVKPGKVGGALGRPDDDLTNRTSEVLRALRALTDHDEFGPITPREYRALPFVHAAPGGGGVLERDSLVKGLPRGRSRYHGYWMSHGASFYAPERTQRAIKSQWRRFVANFDCKAKLSDHRWDPDFLMGQVD